MIEVMLKKWLGGEESERIRIQWAYKGPLKAELRRKNEEAERKKSRKR